MVSSCPIQNGYLAVFPRGPFDEETRKGKHSPFFTGTREVDTALVNDKVCRKTFSLEVRG